jgi:uncharacterized membrane protein YeaQ/YmgE (transglycosylase-associated protein family)
MNIISWIIFGLIAGAIAKLVMPGKDPGGCLVTSGIGILGAMVGGLIATRVLHISPVTGFNMRSFAIAILGSIVLLVIYRLLVGRRR